MSCESGTGGVGWSFEFPATVGAVGTVSVLSHTGIVYLLKVPEGIRKAQELPKIYSGVILCFFFYCYCLITSITVDTVSVLIFEAFYFSMPCRTPPSSIFFC